MVRTKKKEYSYLAFDLETNKFTFKNGNKITLEFGCYIAFDLEKREQTTFDFFNQYNKFFEYIVSEIDKGIYVIGYCHNLDFDMQLVFPYFQQFGINMETIINGNKWIMAKFYRYITKIDKKGKERKTKHYLFEMRDSFALFQVSLKKLGSFVGLEKLESDLTFSDKITEQDLDYCYRDCEIIMKAMFKFTDFMENLGIFDKKPVLTTSSAAFKVFRSKTDIMIQDKVWNPYLDDIDENIQKFFQKHYFGARTEVFNFNIIEKAYYYDINSLYPSVMIGKKYPLPPYEIHEYHSWKAYTNVFAFRCNVIENSDFPLIPTRLDNMKLLFRNGLKENVMIFKEEYEYLKKNNASIQILDVITCSNFDFPFNYLQQFYDLKKAKDSMSYFYKILLNSTYGRFGINIERESLEVLSDESESPDCELVMSFDENNELKLLDELYVKRKKRIIPFKRNMVFASLITALARLELTKSLCKIGRNNCLYCDTDSIISKIPFEGLLICDNELGNWKNELGNGNSFDLFLALGVKEYIGYDKNGVKITAKGIRERTLTNILNYHLNGTETWSLSKIKTKIRKNLDSIYEQTMIKKSSNTYDKRLILENFETIPFDNDSEITKNAHIFKKICCQLLLFNSEIF